MITRKEIKHIAKLARIHLTEDEEKKLGHEIASILEFVEKLKEVDTDEVMPMTGSATLSDIMRLDEVLNKTLEGNSEKLLGQAPERTQEWIKVKAVFE